MSEVKQSIEQKYNELLKEIGFQESTHDSYMKLESRDNKYFKVTMCDVSHHGSPTWEESGREEITKAEHDLLLLLITNKQLFKDVSNLKMYQWANKEVTFYNTLAENYKKMINKE